MQADLNKKIKLHPGTLYRDPKSPYWYLDVTVGGQRYWQTTGKTDQKTAIAWARDFIEQRRLHGRAPEKVKVGDLLDLVLRDYEQSNRPDSLTIFAEPSIRLHLRPSLGHLRAGEVSTEQIEDYKEKKRRAGLAPATINKHLALLRRGFTLGYEHRPPLVDRARVPIIRKLRENNTRKGFFEPEEFERMVKFLPEPINHLTRFAYQTGCRREEVRTLNWSQIDLKEWIVRLEPGTTKNEQGRTFHLVGNLRQAFEDLKRARDRDHPRCPWVFSRNGREVKDWREAWDSACKQAGIVDDAGEPAKLFHDLRRSGVRNLRRSGVSETVAMRISGHKTRAVFDRYNIVDEADIVDAAERVSHYLESRGKDVGKPGEPDTAGGTEGPKEASDGQ
jgi:integrase